MCECSPEPQPAQAGTPAAPTGVVKKVLGLGALGLVVRRVIACVLILLGLGCSGDSEALPNTGLLLLRWSLDGSSDPAHCKARGAESLELTVLGASAQYVAEAEAPCTALALTITLGPGDYSARASLIDGLDVPVSRRILLPEVTISGEEEVPVEIDFGGEDFF